MNGFRALDVPLSRTSILGILAIVPLSLTGCSGPKGPVDGTRAYAHVEKMVSFGPRPPGTPALNSAADYIGEQIQSLGLKPREQKWTEKVEVYGKPSELAFRNVWTEIPGKDPDNGPILLLAAHYDSKLCEGHPDPTHNFGFVGAIDGGGASGVLLELARVLKDRDNVPNLWLVWFDGEEALEWNWTDDKAMFGSRHFAKTMSADKKLFPNGLAARMKAMVLMDLIGDRNQKIDKDTRSQSKLLEIFKIAADEMGESERMFEYESPMVDDHVPFKNRGVAVIDLIDFKWRTPAERMREVPNKPSEEEYVAWWHTPLDTMDNVSADSLAFVGNLVHHALPAIEQQFYAP